MKDLYLAELLNVLDNVEIWESNKRKYNDYSEGVQALVELFREHKRDSVRYKM